MRGLRNQRGFTLIEVVISIALGSLIAASLGGVLLQSLIIPGRSISELVLAQEVRTLTTWLRLDGNKAQSFQLGVDEGDYGSFYWLDYATYPPTRRTVQYFWEEGTVYRLPTIEGDPEAPIPLIRNVESATDVTFALTESEHALNDQSVLRLLQVSVTGTSEPTTSEPVLLTDTVEVELRPEQLNPAEHLFFYLHNDPSPPVADTASQVDLTMDATAPTGTTLYNYDTDNDAHPGREIRKTQKGGELGTTNDWEFQDWLSAAFPSTTTIDGRASLFITGAAGNFTDDALIVVSAWLLDYDPVLQTDTVIVSRAFSGFTSTTGWSEVGVHFRDTFYEMDAGHQLRLKVQIDGVSLTVTGMVAYDTVEHSTLLMVPVQPRDLGIRDFSDIQFGGTTSGSVIDFGGLDVEIEDLVDPLGFRLTVSGSGGGTATVAACGSTILLDEGDVIEFACGSLLLTVVEGPVDVVTSIDAVATVPDGTEATITNVTGGIVVENSADSQDAEPVTISLDGSAEPTEVEVAASATVEIVEVAEDEFLFAVPADAEGDVTVEVGGTVIVLMPGDVLPAGPRGTLKFALAALRPFEDESEKLRDVVRRLEEAAESGAWIDGLHLDADSQPEDGKHVFDDIDKAVRDLRDVENRDISELALATATESADRITGAARRLAIILRDEVLTGGTLDPENEDEVEDLLGDAQGFIATADADRALGNLSFAVKEYADAWERLVEALELQAEPLEGDEDDEGPGNSGGQGPFGDDDDSEGNEQGDGEDGESSEVG